MPVSARFTSMVNESAPPVMPAHDHTSNNTVIRFHILIRPYSIPGTQLQAKNNCGRSFSPQNKSVGLSAQLTPKTSLNMIQ
jgi:hypothetical protein